MEDGASLKNLSELIKKICLFKIPPIWFYWLLIPILIGMYVMIDVAMKSLHLGDRASESTFVLKVVMIKLIIVFWFFYMVACSIIHRIRHIISTQKCITHILISFIIAFYILPITIYV